MSAVRIRDGLVLVGGAFAGGICAAMGGGAIVVELASLWGPAKWLDIAWVQAAYILIVLAGMIAGVEAAGRLGGVTLPGPFVRRVSLRLAIVAVGAAWFGVSKVALFGWVPYGFWVSITGVLALGLAMQVAVRRFGI